MDLAHRTIVMRRGVQVAEFDRALAHAEDIVAAASGLNQHVSSPVAARAREELAT
jgi:rhamnose transport system ATP-binding protein